MVYFQVNESLVYGAVRCDCVACAWSTEPVLVFVGSRDTHTHTHTRLVSSGKNAPIWEHNSGNGGELATMTTAATRGRRWAGTGGGERKKEEPEPFLSISNDEQCVFVTPARS